MSETTPASLSTAPAPRRATTPTTVPVTLGGRIQEASKGERSPELFPAADIAVDRPVAATVNLMKYILGSNITVNGEPANACQMMQMVDTIRDATPILVQRSLQIRHAIREYPSDPNDSTILWAYLQDVEEGKWDARDGKPRPAFCRHSIDEVEPAFGRIAKRRR